MTPPRRNSPGPPKGIASRSTAGVAANGACGSWPHGDDCGTTSGQRTGIQDLAGGGSSKSDRLRQLRAESDGTDAYTEVSNFDDPMKWSRHELHLRRAKDQSRESPRRRKEGEAVTGRFPP